MVTVADVLRLALPVGSTVRAGHQHLSAPVTWARSIRPRSAPLAALEHGDFLLLSLERGAAGRDERTISQLVRDLAAAGASGLCCLGEIDPWVVGLAEQHRLPLIGLPVGSDLLELERRIVALVVDREAGLRQRVEEVHVRLLASLIEDQGAQPLLETLADASGKAVLTFDEYLHPAESAGLPLDQRLAVQEGVRSQIGNLWERPARARFTRGAMLAAGQLAALTVPLFLKGTPVGALCLVGTEGSFSEFDERIATRAAAVLVLEVAKQRAIAAAQLRQQGDFLVDLLAGSFPTEDAMRTRAHWLGHDLSRPHAVVSLALDPTVDDAEREQRLRVRMGDAGWLESSRTPLDALVLSRNGRLVVLLPLEPGAVDLASREAAEKLRRGIATSLGDGARVSAGVGSYTAGLTAFARMHRESERALAVAQELWGGDCTATFRELGASRLLAELLGNVELDAFFEDQLGKLVDYDHRHNSDLLATLEVFFEANSNHVRAARLLHLHRNTLLYRLDRVRAILGADLEDAETRLALQLALKLKCVAKGYPRGAAGERGRATRPSTPERSAS